MNLSLPIFVLYAFVINAMSWLAFAGDKAAARAGLSRVPERSLIGLVLLGGAPAAWAAQQILRHKTQKEPFRTGLPLAAAVWSALWVGAAAWVGYNAG